jgi:choline-sulfatase
METKTFSEVLASVADRLNEGSLSLNATFEFDLTDGGTYRLVMGDGRCSVEESDGAADATFFTTEQNAAKLLHGRLDLAAAFATGELRVDGDIGLLMQLGKTLRAALSSPDDGPQVSRPNILFLMSDEHRPDVVGYEGNEVIRTPTLDWLAETGVVFRNAYTPSPICIPGRQAMMTGQLPRTCGCEWYGQDLEPGSMTFARRLAQHAYSTVACGKLHHMGSDQMQGWTKRIGDEANVAMWYIPDRDEESYAKYAQPGNQHKWTDVKEILRAGVGRGPGVTTDEYTVLGALNYIQKHFNSPYYDRVVGSPLLLKVSLIQPHFPYFTSEEKFNYYLNRVEPFLDQEVADHPFLSQRQVRVGADVTERDMVRATAVYYGMIETIDDHYGQVLRALEQVGQDLDDWIIVYTSDHGEMLGEHGIWEKQKFYEASARVPLIIRWPKGFDGGRVVEENVNLCDLFATLCDLTDIPQPDGLDSRSLVPLLKGQDVDWDNETISQFGDMNLMIKRDHLKYQYYGVSSRRRPPDAQEDTAGSEVLFDLEKDPGETTNTIDHPAYAEAVTAFRARLAELGHGPDADPDYVNAGY